MLPILDKLIDLPVEEDNEAYGKCRDLACNVRKRLVVWHEKEKARQVEREREESKERGRDEERWSGRRRGRCR